MELDEFIKGYITCALWAETDEEEPLDTRYVIEDIAPVAMVSIAEDCLDFQQSNADLLQEYVACGRSMAQAGHDFWLTRNGHGAGFWDRGFGEVGDKLTAAAKVYGSCDIYVGDDGKLYI